MLARKDVIATLSKDQIDALATTGDSQQRLTILNNVEAVRNMKDETKATLFKNAAVVGAPPEDKQYADRLLKTLQEIERRDSAAK